MLACIMGVDHLYFRFCFLLLLTAYTNAVSSDSWTLSYPENADFLIGGIFSVRGMCPGTTECTDINPFYVIQSEAVVYAIQQVNNGILGNLNLSIGVIGFDACDNTQIAYQKGIAFIEGRDTSFCDVDMSEELTKMVIKPYCPVADTCDIKAKSPVHLVTGSITSDMAKGLSPLFQYFCIPLISSYSSSDELGDAELYPYFARTIPPNSKLAVALLKVLLYFNWTSVNVVYDDTEYGKDLYNKFTDMAGNKICIRNYQSLSAKSMSKWPNEELLSTWHNTTEILLVLADYISVTEFFKTLHKMSRKFQLVGPDGWSSLLSVTKGIESTVNGAITLEPLLKPNWGFRQHLDSLTIEDTVNPWMQSLIAWQNNCSIDQSSIDQSNKRSEACPSGACLFTKICNGSEKLDKVMVEPWALQRSHFVIEVVDLFARAVITYCNLTESFCQGDTFTIKGESLLGTIFNLTLDDQLAEFQWDGRNGQPDYSIMQFRASFYWFPIGQYRNGALAWYIDPIVNQSSIMAKVAQCRSDCSKSQYREPAQNCHCCTVCKSCAMDSYVDNNTCIPCKRFEHVVDNACVRQPSMIFFTHDVFNVALFIVSLVGLVLSVILVGFFIVKRNTPLVQVQFGRLGLLLVPAVACLFLTSTLSLSSPATDVMCGANVYLWCLALTVAFAILSAKVLRMDVCSNIERSADFPYRYCSFDKEKLTRTILIGSLVVLNFVFFIWLGYRQGPYVESLLDVICQSQFLACAVMRDPISLVNLIPLVGMLITTVIYGYRGLSATYVVFRYEARQSLIAALGVILSLFFAIPIQFITEEAEVRGVAIASRSIMPGLVLLLVCLLPPTYVILRRPEKNTYESLQRKVVAQRRRGAGGVFLITIESFQTKLKRKISGAIPAAPPDLTPACFHRPSTSTSTSTDDGDRISIVESSNGSTWRKRVRSEGEKPFNSRMVQFQLPLRDNSIKTNMFEAVSMPDVRSMLR